jgi:predicted Zn-dependent protease
MHVPLKGPIVLLCLALFLFVAPSCARNPVSGEQEFMLVSEESEIQLGMKADGEITRGLGLSDDPRLTAYLDGMCQRIAKLSHRPGITYHLRIIDASVVNAFAAPGGYVYFTRGILASMNSEAELAGVMAHEIGHIAARHSAQQYSRQQAVNIGLLVPDLLGVPLISGLTRLGTGVLFLSFSRDNERQADSLSVEYATRAGYDASELCAFFETLERMNPGPDRSGLPSWFSTHPSPDDRINAIRTQSHEWKSKTQNGRFTIGHDEYLKAIDGLVYGEDPSQGYVDKDVFYHPVMKFQFPVPAGWRVTNTPALVQLASPKGDAALVFSLAPGASPQESALKYVADSRARIVRNEALTIGGLKAQRLVADVHARNGYIRLVSCFIMKDKNVYVFHGITNPRLLDSYYETFVQTSGQFRTLTDPGKINRKPDRIRIRPAPSSGTLGNALLALGTKNEKIREIAIMNGGLPEEKIRANTLLKVVEQGR